MKLYELVGVKKFADLDYKDVLSSMHEYKKAGEGCNAIVVKHGARNEVIKFWLEDSAYEDFIDYVQKHPSKYFPKLYSRSKELTAFFLRPRDFPKKVKYIRMEELEEFNPPFPEFLSDLRQMYNQMRKSDDTNIEDFKKMYQRFDEDFIKTVYGLATSLNAKYFVDLHAGNVMMRGKTPVIIDPMGSSKSMNITARIIRRLQYAKNLPSHEVSIGRSNQ